VAAAALRVPVVAGLGAVENYGQANEGDMGNAFPGGRSSEAAPRTHRRAASAAVRWVLLCGVMGLAAAGQAGASPLRAVRNNPFEATTSPEARRDAVRSIPLEKLDEAGRAKVQQVLSNVTIFRRLPVCVIDCDPHLHLFLVRHPDVVVNIWEVLNFSELQLRRTGANTFQVVEAEGSAGEVEFLYGDHETHVVYVEGTYIGPLLKRPVKGRCLLVLKTGYVLETDGRHYITNRLDTFVNVDPGGVELLTKTVQPLIGRVADNNFTQTVAFVGSLSRTAEVNGPGVERLASRLLRVHPDSRQRFAEVATGVGRRTSAAAIPAPRAATLATRPNDAAPPRAGGSAGGL
jgi:hypothetical protein